MKDGAPVRLLIVGIRWPAETFIMRLIKGLTQAGIDVTVASRDTVKGGPEYGGRLHWLPAPVWSESGLLRLPRLVAMGGRAALRAPADLRLLARCAAERQGIGKRMPRLFQLLPFAGCAPDAIYFPWNSAAIAYLPLFDFGSPVVVSCRGAQVNVAPGNPRRAGIRDGLRATFERAAAVHCVSEDILREAEQFGLDRAKARIIRPAVDPEHFRPGEAVQDDGVFRIVSTGSVIWRKGYEYALQAVRLLVDRGVRVRYEIIGSGDERDRVVYTIRDLGLEDAVELRGQLPPDDVLRILQSADAFVLPSLSEGISNAVLEAMACGIPVVTTDCGGMREAVTDGVEGFVVPVRDPAAMAAALGSLAASADLKRRMGAAGRERIVREFSLDRQVDLWLDLYRSIGVGR